MAVSCSLVNKETKQPIPFYKVNGQYFREFSEAIKNSEEGSTVEVALLNTDSVTQAFTEEDFKSKVDGDVVFYDNTLKVNKSSVEKVVARIPVTFDTSKKEGVINTLISRNQMSPEVNHYEGVTYYSSFGKDMDTKLINAEALQTELTALVGKDGFTRDGVIFTIEGRQEVETNPVGEAFLEASAKANGKPELIPTLDTNDSLVSLLTNFLNEVGIDVVNIEEYKKRYASKHGISPDAKGLADIANAVIALANGEVIDESVITEEVAHFIVEGMPESDALLDDVVGTEEWVKHSERYRNIYAESISDPFELETAVKKEILGKILAKSMQESFTPTLKDESFFNRVWEGFLRFLDRVIRKRKDGHSKKIQDFTKRVNVLLKNEQLKDAIEMNRIYESKLPPLYALSENSDMHKMTKSLQDALKHAVSNTNRAHVRALEDGVFDRMEEAVKELEKLTDADIEANELRVLQDISLLTEIVSTQSTALLTEIANIKDGEFFDNEIETRFNTIKELILEPLTSIKSQLNSEIQSGKFKIKNHEAEQIINNINSVLVLSTDVQGGILRKRALTPENLVDRVAREEGFDGDTNMKGKLLDFIKGVFKEQGWLQTYLGRAVKSSNPFVQRIGKIAHDNYTKTSMFMNNHVKPIVQRLSENSSLLDGLIDKTRGVLFSHYNTKKEEERNEALTIVVKQLFKDHISNRPHLNNVELTDEDIQTLIDKNFSQYAFDDMIRDKLSSKAKDLLKSLTDLEYQSIGIFKGGETSLNSDGDNLIATMKTEFAFNSAKIKASLLKNGHPVKERTLNRIGLFEKGINGYNLSKDTYLKETYWSGRRGDVAKKIPRDSEGHVDGGDPRTARYDVILQNIKSERAEAKSIFLKNGQPKRGFSLMVKGQALKAGQYEYEVNNDLSYVFVEADASPEAKLAYDLYILDKQAREENERRKANGEPSLFPEGDEAFLMEEIERYQDSLQGKGYSQKEINKRTYNWFKRNASIAFTDIYRDQFQSGTAYRDKVLNFANNKVSARTYKVVEGQLREIADKRFTINTIINKAKSFLDYREISPQMLDITSRNMIDKLEGEISLIRANIEEVIKNDLPKGTVFDIHGMSGSKVDMATFFNNEFFSQFYAKYNVEWENATANSKVEYLKDKSQGDDAKYYELRNKYNKILSGNSSINMTDDIRKKLGNYFVLADDSVLTVEDVNNNLQQFLMNGIPAYWKRTTPQGYQDLNRGLESGELNIIDDVLKNKSVLGDMMEIKPSYSMVEDDYKMFKLGEHLFDKKMEAIRNTNYTSRGRRLADTYEAFMHIAGRDYMNIEEKELNQEFLNKYGIKATFQNDGRVELSEPTRNLDSFESLLDLMELNRVGYKSYGEINSRSIFNLPQIRRTNLDRIKSSGPKAYFDELVNSMTNRNEDEAYENQKKARSNNLNGGMFIVPKQGLRRIPLEDLSFDVLASFTKFAHDGKQCEYRKGSLDEAIATREAISTMNFKDGKAWKETNDYKMATNVINAQFLGQTPVYEANISLPNGKKLDMAKMAHGFRRFVSANNLMFSPIIAMTSAVTASLNKSLARFSNYNLHSGSSTRADSVFLGMFAGGVSDMGKVTASSEIDGLGEWAGLYNMIERTENAKYGMKKNIWDLEKLGYSIHSMANYVISPRVMLSKLMEYRVINDPEIGAEGVLLSWSNFLERKKMSNPNLTKSEIEAQFNEASGASLYDMLKTENGITKVDYAKAKALGVKDSNIEEYFEILQQKVNRDVMSAISQFDGVIHASQATEGQRHPLMSFLFLHRAWFVIASEKVFGSGGFDVSTGNFDKSVGASLKALLLESFAKKDEITGKLKFTFNKDGWNKLTEAEKSNNRYLMANLSAILGLVVLSSAMLGWSDDDDENYIAQLSATLALRVLGETTSASLGLPSEYMGFMESPLAVVNTVKNVWGITKLWELNEEVSQGMYKGDNKYWNTWFKLTFLKNVYMYQDTDHIAENRKGYQYFNEQQSMYSFLPLAKWLSKKE